MRRQSGAVIGFMTRAAKMPARARLVIIDLADSAPWQRSYGDDLAAAILLHRRLWRNAGPVGSVAQLVRADGS